MLSSLYFPLEQLLAKYVLREVAGAIRQVYTGSARQKAAIALLIHAPHGYSQLQPMEDNVC